MLPKKKKNSNWHTTLASVGSSMTTASMQHSYHVVHVWKRRETTNLQIIKLNCHPCRWICKTVKPAALDSSRLPPLSCFFLITVLIIRHDWPSSKISGIDSVWTVRSNPLTLDHRFSYLAFNSCHVSGPHVYKTAKPATVRILGSVIRST